MRNFASLSLSAVLIAFLLVISAVHSPVSAQDATPVATEAISCDPTVAIATASAMLKPSGNQDQDIITLNTARDYLTFVLQACQPAGKWTAQQVIDAFKAANLEVVSPIPDKDFGIVPYAGKDELHFIIPSLCSDCGGRVYAFNDPVNQTVVAAYYASFGKPGSTFGSWVFQKDNILLQINGQLPEAKANAYQAALDQLK